MTPSTAAQTPIERPSEDFRKAVHVCARGPVTSPLPASMPSCLSASPAIELAGVKIFASRNRDRVTGRVEFPYPVGNRTSVPIAYRNAVPLASMPNASMPGDPIALARLSLVARWRELCSQNPKRSRLSLANRVADSAPIKCSPRSLQAWSQRLDLEGPAGLCDRYTPAPPAVLSLDPQAASDAVLICAWWSFRVGGVDTIDTKMIYSAAALTCHPERSACHPERSEGPHRQSAIPVADILASVDAYYSWPCDRQRFPFKSFARWARYDFETWLFRACDKNDYRTNLPPSQGGIQGGLRPPQTIRRPDISDPRSRNRDVYDRTTRAAIACHPERSEGSACNPSPLVSWLHSLDPRWRGFFLRVAKGDRQAKFELIATLPLWWDGLPETVRREIDDRIEAWIKDRSRTEVQIATRRVLSLIPRLRDVRGELTALSSAARMVV